MTPLLPLEIRNLNGFWYVCENRKPVPTGVMCNSERGASMPISTGVQSRERAIAFARWHWPNRALLIFFAALALMGCMTGGPGLGNPENETATICVTRGASVAMVQAAADAWAQASAGRVALIVVDGGDCSDYETRVVAEPDVRGEDGTVACGKADTDGRTIHFSTSNCVATQNTYTHELGHFLTGPEHSASKEDIMYHAISLVQTPTAADVARLP